MAFKIFLNAVSNVGCTLTFDSTTYLFGRLQPTMTENRNVEALDTHTLIS